MALLVNRAVDQLNSSPSLVKEVQYCHDGPLAITQFTMVNNKTDAGADSNLLINA